MYETRLSRMIMQLPPAQMANRDGDAGMETMLWDINIIFFFALCCLGKIPGGAPFSQLHKSGSGGREDRP